MKVSNEHTNNQPLVSLVIPAYNAAAYIQRCLDSALHQDYPNIEIIVIDDGSTDSTSEILKGYGSQPGLVVTRMDNAGPSAARNAGIDRAKGEFLCFLDADDFVSPNYVSLLTNGLYRTDTLPELVVSEYIDYAHSHPQGLAIKQIQNDGLYPVAEFIPFLFQGTMGVLWGKLFSSNIILKNNLRLVDSISYQEDLVFVYSYLQHCRSVYYLSEPTYHYNRLNDQSLTVQLNEFHAQEFEKVQKALLQLSSDDPSRRLIEGRTKQFYSQLLLSMGWHAESTKKTIGDLKKVDCKRFAAMYKGNGVYKPYYILLAKGLTRWAIFYLQTLKAAKKAMLKRYFQ